MFSGMGKPGQRETSRVSRETEVTITVYHALGASIAFSLTFLALRWLVFFPVAEHLATLMPESRNFVGYTAEYVNNALIIAGLVLPWLSLGGSFAVQVWDRNWTPPRSARNGDDGPAAPRIIRWMFGLRNRGPVPTKNYEGLPSVPDIKQHSVKADLAIRDGKTVYLAQPDLTIAEWDKLAAMFRAGHYSVSVRDLAQFGKFGKGKEGAARYVNNQIKSWTGLTKKGKRGKFIAVEVFRKWVIDGKYRDGMPPGALPHPSPTAQSV